MRKTGILLFLVFGLQLGFYGSLFSQEILLDKGVKAGKLDCFPVYGNEKTFYYLPAHPRLATVNGKPQFSFIKYVQNVPKGKEGGTTEGTGGGLVHFLVEYGATDDERAEAEQELQSQVPGARLAGPVMYRDGTFALVTAFTKENGELVKQIAGLGKAPIMEGHKAAVAMQLTQQGATLLWESFKNPTSQISVAFEMEAKGYRKPYEATLTADWEQINKSDRVAIGAKYKWLGVDIDMLFQELRKEGSIKLEVKGASQEMDKIWATAFNALMQQMFERDNVGNALPSVQESAGFSNLNKATEFLAKEEAKKKEPPPAPTPPMPLERPYGTIPPSGLVLGAGPSGISGDILFGHGRQTAQSGQETKKEEKAKEQEKKGEKPEDKKPAVKPDQKKPEDKKPADKPDQKKPQDKKPGPKPGDKKTVNNQEADKNKEGSPGFAIIASYQMKRIKQSGKAVINLNQWREETQPFRFSENIGGLNRYINDPNFFRAVNLDDPVYKQREVVVMLDGQDSSDFAKYINYVTVQIRKDHESGEMTHDELVIKKTNFDQNSNNFMMMYGWKGDNDRTRWLTYQYKTRWSFFGGVFAEEDWKRTDDFVITVTAPHKYRRIVLEADPDVFRDREVRDASVKFYYNFYGKEMVEQATLKATENNLSKQLEYAHPEGNFDYEYEITWHLRGGRVLTSGRLKASGDVIYCDELPEETPAKGR